MSSKRIGERSVIDRLQQAGSYRCLFPHTRDTGLEAVLLNTAGGITGGDQFRFSGRVAPNTTLSLTTQACERAYKAQPGQVGVIRNDLVVCKNARLNWLPQETILFDGSALNRRLVIEVAADAQALVVEPMIFGRPAMGEVLADIYLDDRIEIRCESKPAFIDAIRYQGNLHAHLANPNIGGGAGAMALIVFASALASGHLNAVREMLPEMAGASLIHDDLLVIRLLARTGFELRRALLPIIRRLNSETLPKCWML